MVAPPPRIPIAMPLRWAALVAVLAPLPCRAGTPLVELKVSGKTYQGRVDALDSRDCWLMSRSGRLDRLTVDRIEAHKQVSSSFRSHTAAEVRDHLRRELGDSYEITASEHYLVGAKKGQAAKLAPMFEEVYRSFRQHFSVRGFPMKSPEFPMVAVVCPTRDAFVELCRHDGMAYTQGLLGYYHPATNRVTLYDAAENDLSAAAPKTPAADRPVPFESVEEPGDSPFRLRTPVGKLGIASDVKATLQYTVIHEATHQAAYNTGLHQRIGETPRWVVEGLATVFEAPGIREGGGKSSPVMQRINRERYVRFGNFVKERRPEKSLAQFLSQDEMLRTATLDFYAQSWALTFFLLETRGSAYPKFLKTVTTRDPLTPYDDSARLKDFRDHFGDVERLEVEFLRYLSRLEKIGVGRVD